MFSNLKVYERLVFRGIIAVFLVSLIGIVAAKSVTTWSFIKTFFIIIPVFLTANILSEEYEQNRFGIVFVTRTPIYKYMLKRFLWGWGFTQVLSGILFMAAYYTGVEDRALVWIIMLVYSTFLSLLGLTAGNITKNSLLAYGVPLAYWGMGVAAGVSFNEKIINFSVMIGITITREMIWSNIITLSIISILLMAFNIWYAGRGEKSRNAVLGAFAAFACIAAVLAGFNYYDEYSKSILQYKILKADSTMFVVDENSINAKEFLEENNIQYITSTQFDTKDLGKQNTVIIAESKTAFEQNIKKEIEALEQLSVSDAGVSLKDTAVSNAAYCRAVVKEKDKYLVYMESQSWLKEQLGVLFDKKSGNFIAGNQEGCMVEGNYNIDTFKGVFDNVKLKSNDIWLIKGSEEAKVKYHAIKEEEAEELLNIWRIIKLETDKVMNNSLSEATLQTCLDNDGSYMEADGIGGDTVQVYVPGKLFFEPYKSGGYDRITHLSMVYFEENVFKNIEDTRIREAFSNYMLKTKIMPAMEKQVSDAYWNRNYSYLPGSFTSLEEIQNIMDRRGSFGRFDIENVAAYILYYCDKKEKLMPQILADIYSSQASIDTAKLQEIIKGYINSKEVDDIFDAYKEAKAVADQYKTYRWVRVEEKVD